MGSNNSWDAEEIFQKYLHDYLVKKNMHRTAEIFAKEANADVCPVASAIDSPEGFLAEWWSVFYDVYFPMLLQHEEAVKIALNKGKQVTGTTAQNLCSETLRFEKNQQSSVQFPVGSHVGSMLPQQAPKTYEEGNRRHTIADSQFANVDQSRSKSVESSQSNPQRQPRKQAQQRQGKKRFSTPVSSSVNGGPKSIGSESVSNEAPLKGWPLLGAKQVTPRMGHQVLSSYLPSANNQQQMDIPEMHSQQQLFAQILAAATATALSTDSGMPPGNGSDETSGQLIEQIMGTRLQKFNDPVPPFRQNVVAFGQQKKPSEDFQDEEKMLLHESIERFLSNYDDHADHINSAGIFLPDSRSYDKKEHAGMSLEEVGSLHASKGKIFSCNFSPDGKLLASAGQDKKVYLWNMATLGYISTLESHAQLVTDVQFHPSSELFATSSFDKTVQIWDAARQNSSLFKLLGHNDHVMSLNFHPRKMDLLCSCDSNDEIRLWNLNEYTCLRVSKGAMKQVRFQPQLGRLLATAAGNGVNIFDVETGDFLLDLKGHHSEVRSISWDVTGKYIASVSEETVRLWSVLTGGQCIYELHSKGNNFQSSTFHPGYPLLLVIGSYQSLSLWNPSQSSRFNSIQAHSGHVGSLASSPATGLIASASHDQCVKLWR